MLILCIQFQEVLEGITHVRHVQGAVPTAALCKNETKTVCGFVEGTKVRFEAGSPTGRLPPLSYPEEVDSTLQVGWRRPVSDPKNCLVRGTRVLIPPHDELEKKNLSVLAL
ncbi:hypothetical protein AVEN_254294-1 [Araneus ventricosus]|uniref:Uncharacterized protein n=1 Tax=Araneus ventricosus TaxID=182803 RepID=A0A4Y2FDM7_ARAVE|nr:hypothetical protein AVEN_254294-1 [Araneus ventricosus]